MDILFQKGEDIKQYVSGIHASIDIDNLRSSMEEAAEDIADVISGDVYQLAVSHYQSDNYQKESPTDTEKKLDKLVHLIQSAMAPKGLLHHFIWLEISVNNQGVTTVKGTNQTAAYKYQTQEAKDSLLEKYNRAASQLIDYLNPNATPFTEWKAGADYKAGAVVRKVDTFYTANADFTSGETFDAANWTVKPETEVLFWQWTISDQKKESEGGIFTGYRDFDKHYGIDASATFFVRARHIIKQNTARHIKPRFGSDIPAEYLDTVKDALAHLVIADAILKLDFNLLPKSLRGPINNEMNKKGGDVDFVRDKLRNRIMEDADYFLKNIDREKVIEEAEPEETAPLDNFEIEQSPDKKFYSSI